MGKKKKVILPPDLPVIGDDEIQVSDEDLEFIGRNREYAGFLTRLDTKSIDRHVTRVADHKEDELESLYEKRNRKASLLRLKEEEDKLHVDPVDALPVKTLDGKLEYRTADKLKSGDRTSENKSKDDEEDAGGLKLTKPEKRQKLKKSRKEAKKLAKEQEKENIGEEEKGNIGEGKLHTEVLAKVEEDLSSEELFRKKKIRLAEIGLQLLENPEENIKALKELLQICDDEDHNIVKLGLMSLLAVFKDIIPGYRIRLPTEKETEMTVSKAVRQQRFYESTLLRSYKEYLTKLIALEKQPSVHQVAVRCLCSLLDAVSHFNFRQSVLVSVVKNISSLDDTIRKLCCEAIRSLFLNEGKHGGEATLEAVRLIADQVKFHQCQLHPDSIDVFLSLMFDEDIGKSEAVEEEVRPKKKRNWRAQDGLKEVQTSDRKKNKQEIMTKTREEVSADFKAVSFAPDSRERKRMQSETLSAVFETYFRILKHSMDPSTSRSHPLLAPSLNGLGKFSHFIDLDFMGDLLRCLKKLAGHSNHNVSSTGTCLSVSERLQCCIVAFRVMRNNLDALNVDLQDFFIHLYNLLLEYRPDRDHGEVLAEALKTMLWEGKQHDMQRAAAFIKRLATFSLSHGSAEAMAALVTLKHLLQKNSKCRNLLENDAGGGSLAGLVSKYQPDATDPNLSGALASVLWELSLLMKHYNPSISTMATSISTMASMDPAHSQVFLSTASPLEAFTDSSLEQELLKTTGKPTPSSYKRRREIGNDFVIMDPYKMGNENVVDEDEVRRKLEDHFVVHKGIAENERLRRELNYTLSSISLFEDYKREKRHKKKGKR
ncbi:nucleolar complex protein [Canna indica]|uniref:Nucleolar complex protein n=1 Tax=Canna indica TaxID=4628 RepID=A0AAQ3QKC0_9LILI|nr:nucleolar complex protein [Canna indica]